MRRKSDGMKVKRSLQELLQALHHRLLLNVRLKNINTFSLSLSSSEREWGENQFVGGGEHFRLLHRTAFCRPVTVSITDRKSID